MDQSLIVFVRVAEKQNFTRAAEVLHMTQPAVSQYIQTLERSVGTRLLERSNKYVRLTKAGEIVYHHAQEIIRLHTRMQYLVDELIHTAKGNLSIGASYTYGEYVLPHVIAQMRIHYPLIQPSITIGNTQEIEKLMIHNQLDVGIIEGEFQHDHLHIESFADDRMYIVVPQNHSLAGKSQVDVSELQEDVWILREEGSGTREAAEKMFARLQFSPSHMMNFGSTQIIKESVEAGLGISLLSQWVIQKELALGTLKVLDIRNLPVIRKFSFLTPSSTFETKACTAFLEILRSYNVKS
ncbi:MULTISPECIES: LysR family transcriptional regulator [unclassified Paenibacillus]|uniref:LysR family transcriptional regulator n=1 Tax=unclassified Paenibacillus TaxID=185978 RepID=UPI000C9F77E7|nr:MULTISPECIES: LysR family transcriptional regulator [unclassified Paenibacillus]PNQ79551.1 LysR family transcriptional regulator [Paenibacillus sp. F4]